MAEVNRELRDRVGELERRVGRRRQLAHLASAAVERGLRQAPAAVEVGGGVVVTGDPGDLSGLAAPHRTIVIGALP